RRQDDGSDRLPAGRARRVRGIARGTRPRRRHHGRSPRAPAPSGTDAADGRHDGLGQHRRRLARAAPGLRGAAGCDHAPVQRAARARNHRRTRDVGEVRAVTKRTARRGERGQALAETGIVIVLFVMLVMGTIEFGRAWMISNMITHAARDGARVAATWPTRTSGTISSADRTTIQNQVLTKISNVLGTPTGLAATVTQTTAGTIPTVQVDVTGSVSYLFRLLPSMSRFTINRTVTFRDEGR